MFVEFGIFVCVGIKVLIKKFALVFVCEKKLILLFAIFINYLYIFFYFILLPCGSIHMLLFSFVFVFIV